MENLKKTPLYEIYESYNPKIIDFGGWALPVQFQGIIEEHNNVRTKAGLFDVSHMGQIVVAGQHAEQFLQYLCTNDLSKTENGQAIYTLFCNEKGGIIDDLLVYKIANDKFMLVVNASNIDKNVNWITQQLNSVDTKWHNKDIKVENNSDYMSILALQGPTAEIILQKLTDYDLSQIKRFRFVENIDVAGAKSLIARTGYTGEDGFELYIANTDASKLWEQILSIGEIDGVMPAGLGARDTLRLEAGLPLYGNELNEEITPLEANLKFFVKLTKDDFIGKSALAEQLEQGVSRKIVGFKMLDRGIARTGYQIMVDDKEIGFVTSGSFSPTLKENIGFALIDVNHAEIGSTFGIIIRNKKVKAEIVKTPFFKK